MSLNLIMGARNGAKTERDENDFYATEPNAVRKFLDKLNEDCVQLKKVIWECACGKGHMAEVFKEYGYYVIATDLINRGYGEVENFLEVKLPIYDADIFTNPPFKNAVEFAYHGIKLLEGKKTKLGLFVKIQFLESKERSELFKKYPPKYIYVYSERQQCALNGDFEKYKKGGRTQAYIWVIWEKDYKGEPIVRWI